MCWVRIQHSKIAKQIHRWWTPSQLHMLIELGIFGSLPSGDNFKYLVTIVDGFTIRPISVPINGYNLRGHCPSVCLSRGAAIWSPCGFVEHTLCLVSSVSWSMSWVPRVKRFNLTARSVLMSWNWPSLLVRSYSWCGSLLNRIFPRLIQQTFNASLGWSGVWISVMCWISMKTHAQSLPNSWRLKPSLWGTRVSTRFLSAPR